MTRAVIELTGDISPAMPYLHRSIKTCGYSQSAKVIAFRTGNFGVVVEAGKIIINNAEDVTQARAVIDWLKDIMTKAPA